MGFGSGAHIPTALLSKKLQSILDKGCIKCYDPFDNKNRKPHIVCPC